MHLRDHDSIRIGAVWVTYRFCESGMSTETNVKTRSGVRSRHSEVGNLDLRELLRHAHPALPDPSIGRRGRAAADRP